MLPIYFSYLAGSIEDGKGGEKSEKERLFINSIGFVIGFTIVFVLLGAAATSLGSFLRSYRQELKTISGVVIILFGLNFMGVLRIGILDIEKRFDYKFDRLKFFSSIVFGMVFSFGWTGCIVQFLTPVLAMAADSETLAKGLVLLLIYSLGLGVPFIISAIIFDKIKGAFKFIKKNSRIISIISGVLLILLGIAMIFRFI
jgi:cytochrome c-type biogenesis protein